MYRWKNVEHMTLGGSGVKNRPTLVGGTRLSDVESRGTKKHHPRHYLSSPQTRSNVQEEEHVSEMKTLMTADEPVDKTALSPVNHLVSDVTYPALSNVNHLLSDVTYPASLMSIIW